MRKRRHHNTKGLRQIKRGKTQKQVAMMAKRLGGKDGQENLKKSSKDYLG